MCFKQNSGAGAPDLCDDIALKVFCRTAAGVHAPPQLVALQTMEAMYPYWSYIGPLNIMNIGIVPILDQYRTNYELSTVLKGAQFGPTRHPQSHHHNHCHVDVASPHLQMSLAG